MFDQFQHFLNKYVDDAITGRHTHRMSTTEDDNPPSPMDSIDIFSLSSQTPSTGSPASRQRGETGLRFPMTPPSNPHTPASPSAARMSGVSIFTLWCVFVSVWKMCSEIFECFVPVQINDGIVNIWKFWRLKVNLKKLWS